MVSELPVVPNITPSHEKISSVRNFATQDMYFPAANVCNFSTADIPLATTIAIANLAYSALYVGVHRFPDGSRIKKFAFKIAGRELTTPPLRVTSYCALTVSALLLAAAADGVSAALFPGLAALYFGIGNYIQSDPTLNKLHNDLSVNPIIRSLTHPAVWYGLGYTMTGLKIGSGLALIANASSNLLATGLTLIGIAETFGFLVLMISGKIKNDAAPYVGVAIGTAFFAASGFATGNLSAIATGMFACAGEFCLAILKQKEHNFKNGGLDKSVTASGIENLLVTPIRDIMKRGWVKSLPLAA